MDLETFITSLIIFFIWLLLGFLPLCFSHASKACTTSGRLSLRRSFAEVESI